MIYLIKYNYNTGDSFNTQEGLSDTLEMTWMNLEVAEANVRRIEEHYNHYKEKMYYSYYRTKQDKDLEYPAKTKDWYVDRHPTSIRLFTDDGQPWQIYCPWLGHFESLNYVEVISKPFLKVEF